MLHKEDVIESFIKSQGPGGQNVNKTATCVHLRHLPTGIEVKCQAERTQAQNRKLAWQLLDSKVQAKNLKELAEENARLEKLRRQRRAKPRSLKLKILEAKRKQAQKKLLRQKIRHIEE
ncbi:MAG: peptide chain release factor-like protein [Candidatus Omnitrophota bacterium]